MLGVQRIKINCVTAWVPAWKLPWQMTTNRYFLILSFSIIRMASSVPYHMFPPGIGCKNTSTTRQPALFTIRVQLALNLNLASLGYFKKGSHLERISQIVTDRRLKTFKEREVISRYYYYYY